MQGNNIIRWVMVGLVAFMLFSYYQNTMKSKPVTMTYSELETALEQQPSPITSITITNGSNEVVVARKGQPDAKVVLPTPGGQALVLPLADKAHVTVVAADNTPGLLGTILGIIFSPLTIMIALGWWLLRSQGGMFSKMTQSGVHKYQKTGDRKTFADVAGCTEAKAELEEVVEYLKDQTSFREMGAALPKGVLLIGPPGNGKTLLAKAVAGEANVPFFSIAASQFVELFVGAGAAKVRDLFATARKSMPCIIFIDEIDAVGRHRGGGSGGGGHEEREQTLNEILVQMDGFKENESIVIIAATNRADILDPAVTRSGRFDRHITVESPDVRGREAIFEIHMRNRPIAEDVRSSELARLTPGFSGADIATACNEAATVARRRIKKGRVRKLLTFGIAKDRTEQPQSKLITMADFSEGVDRVLGGPAKDHLMTDEDRLNTAVHEAGHAGVGHDLKGDPIRKVTIMARARALGFTLSLPDRERYNKTKDELLNEIASMMGGRVAQQVVLGVTDTGAANDFQQATGLARRMVTVFGMSELGHISISDENTSPFPGRSSGGQGGSNWGPAVLDRVDVEVMKILADATLRARKVIESRRANLDKVVAKLLEDETILGDEFVALWTAPNSPAPDAEQPEADNPSGSGSATHLLPPQQEGDDQPLPSDRAAHWPGPSEEDQQGR